MTFTASSRSPFGPVLDGTCRAAAPTRARNGARGESPVVSKGDSPRVNQGASARERAHPLVVAMVQEQEQELGSRMRAYDVVGRSIGCKRTWVRRLVGRQAVGMTGDRLLAILAAYRAHCERVERRAAENRAATARRWEEIDEVISGLGEPRPELGREPAESRDADAIALCQHIDGLESDPRGFLIACETLTGRPSPGRAAAETEAERQARHARQAAAAEAANRRRVEREATSEGFREDERRRGHAIWRAASAIGGTIVERYLRQRGIEPFDGLRLRFAPDLALWNKPAPAGQVVHRGPAMLAPIVRDGRFAGVHQTFIDLSDPDGKLRLPDEAGELLPAKKIRGSKTGGAVLLGPVPAKPVRAYLGEGIETVLSVRQALLRCRPQLAEGALFAAAVDLGNLAGRAASSCPHPEMKTVDALGRARPKRYGGPVPDGDPPAIALPDGVAELVLLGDGDSEPVSTGWAMERARARYARAYGGLLVAVAMAPPGCDFNNLLRERAA